MPTGSRISTEGTGVVVEDTVTGAGEVRVAGGTAAVRSIYADSSGTIAVASGATLSVDNVDSYGIYASGNRKLVNNGTLTALNNSGYDTLYLEGAANTLTNNGTLNLANGADANGGGKITNAAAATVHKTGAAESTLSTTVDNFGTMRSADGLLNVAGAFPAISGTTLTRGTYEMVSPSRIQVPTDVVRIDGTVVLDGPSASLSDPGDANGLLNLNRIGATGSLTVKNGRVQNTAALAQTGTLTIGDGTGSQVIAPSMTSTGATSVVSSTSLLKTTGAINVSSGTVSGAGTIQAGGAGVTVGATAIIAPGTSVPAQPATLSITGSLTLLPESALRVDINGTTAGIRDQLAVSGAAALGGNLEITTGYTPAAGDTIDVVTTGGARTGTFDGITGGDVPGNVSWASSYGANAMSLRAAQPQLSIADAELIEGNSGSQLLQFTLTSDDTILPASSATVSTSNGTANGGGTAAAGGQDFTPTSTTVTLPRGVTSATFSVPVAGDGVYEHDDTFTVTLSDANNLGFADGSATGTIRNDENVPSLSVAPATVVEGDPSSGGQASVTATMSGPSEYSTGRAGRPWRRPPAPVTSPPGTPASPSPPAP